MGGVGTSVASRRSCRETRGGLLNDDIGRRWIETRWRVVVADAAVVGLGSLWSGRHLGLWLGLISRGFADLPARASRRPVGRHPP
jgi:hypothetical protein